jgi:hypothetical protein
VRVRVLLAERAFSGGVLNTVIIFHNSGRNAYTPREVIPNHARAFYIFRLVLIITVLGTSSSLLFIVEFNFLEKK